MSGFDATSGGIDLSPPEAVRLFHRADNSTIHVSRKDASGQWQDRIAAFPASCAADMLPALLRKYPTDSYYRLNTPPTRSAPGYLNAAFADLDTYRVDLSDGQAIGRLIDLQDKGTIPPVSVIIRSGRGVWPCWLLYDPQTGKPPLWTADTKRQYQRIQQAIHTDLSGLGAEAKDAERYTRLPGSVNTNSGQAVTYLATLTASGQPHAYTLDQLADFFPAKPKTPRQAKASGLTGRPFNGWERVNASRLARFERLRAMRGSFAEGVRHNACFVYSRLLLLAGHEAGQVFARVSELADECSPPYPQSEAETTVKAALKSKAKLRTQTIADLLDVSPDEAVALKSKPASRHSVNVAVEPKPLGKTGQQALRRQAILDLIQNAGGELLSTRSMAEALSERCGITVAAMTVSRDYRALGML